jgi:ribosomal protein S15P/S13E
MTIRDLVERLEKIEQHAGDNTREDLSLLIEDIIEFDIHMSKMFKDMRNKINIDEKDIMDMLFKQGIKSGEIGEA